MSLFKKFAFLWSYSLLAVIVGTYYLFGPDWVVAGILYTYIVIPLLDLVSGNDRTNVSRDRYDVVVNDSYFDALVYSFVYLHYALIAWGCYVLIAGGLTVWQQLGLIYSIGIFGGGIINVAHELGHRSSSTAQFHAKAALLSVCYMHFIIEHNRGHHVHVATPVDPATAKKNQTLYAFWMQTLVGSYRSAWQIEKRLIQRQGYAVWSRHNDMLWFAGLPILFGTFLTVEFGFWVGYIPWIVPIFFFSQSLIAILLLESVNYIEHYGITRREVSPGQFERVNPLHSWNASQLISNLVLFQLQRHSDHHAYAARPYQVLRHFDEAPQLPFGYALMILISYIPPLWFRLMNPRLERWQARAFRAEEIARAVKQFA
ncbi:alkane 1-monooxygenase [Spirosoma utsteinense]|uniref:Alkane 1-monooxygenase n=1 Tax=Spirosoma utsteinense TaxID=2585773 RepID=A0ABR6W335_9BACT|nr:alkane 1-monooxygenase [Spirosoma utsteinense]MBC3785089.1 alkane 1-monooxygenase [Spirosoma utsteinense]MBC3790302.1 alkane 1-monooxygenase [Spirosoma utsteinense]